MTIQEDVQGLKHIDPKQGLRQDGFVGSVNRFRINPWVQVLVISFVCFGCPGMYNALTGTGGGGQVDPTVNANASIALLSCTAVTAPFLAGPLLALLGPRNSLLVSGWTYALYSGALLNYNDRANGAFVIAAGAILGIGSSFLWVAQGAIMTSYVPEAYKGRSIALFWFIFNIGGTIGSLISFGLNYSSDKGTVSDSTYIAFLCIMIVGWLLSIFVCSPRHINNGEMLAALARDNKGMDEDEHFTSEKLFRAAKRFFNVVRNYKVFCMFPFFFAANVFYPYQQSIVNGYSFNIRTRSLCGALYWIAQMFGGLIMGAILDMIPINRKRRGYAGWVFVLCMTFAIWGGGYAYQKVLDQRHEKGIAAGNPTKFLQQIDYKDGSEFLGPMFLYFFYGAFDSFWQGFAYWMMGAVTNSAYETGVIVGCYKGIQAIGGAMANAILSHNYPWINQFGMNWGLSAAAVFLIIPSVLNVSLTNVTDFPEDTEGEEPQLKAAESFSPVGEDEKVVADV